MKCIRSAWRGGRFLKILRSNDCAAWRHLLFGIPILISALVLISAERYQQPIPPPADADTDGMSDAYEAYACFFGLDPTNTADAYLDCDGDHLNNLREFALLTDPFAPDTDRDGFEDDADANPISRAYIQWGAPQFTAGDYYDYAHPDWFLNAYKSGGEWVATPCERSSTNTSQAYDTAWYVPASESHGVASLSIDLDQTILTNNLRYAVHCLVSSNSSLYVDLLDTNGDVVVKDLYGNLAEKTNAESVIILDVPTATFPNAAVIQIRRGDLSGIALSLSEGAKAEGEVTVYEGLVYIDEDGDGLDSDQERQLGTSDYLVDTDGDGVGDYDEVFIYHTDPCKPDKGKDKDKNKDKKTGIIYVDQAVGSDQHTGRASLVSEKDGPKKTVHKGMAAVAADDAHTLIIKSGAYNENLDLRGKNVKVVIEGNVRL